MSTTTYERQKLWNEYRRSKITKKSSEQDEKDSEELTFQPRTNKSYNRNVKSRLLNSTASLRNANIHRSNPNAVSSAVSFASSSYYRGHEARRRVVSANGPSRRRGIKSKSTSKTQHARKQNERQGSNHHQQTTTKREANRQENDGEGDGSFSDENRTKSAGAKVDNNSDSVAGKDDDDNPNNNSVIYTASLELDSEDEEIYDDGPEGPSKIIGERHSSTGISLHVARQQKARMRKEELRSGKAFRTKRSALHAKPFNLSTTNIRSSRVNGGEGVQPESSGIGGLNLSAVSAVSFSHNVASDSDVQNLVRAHRREIREMQQEHAAELTRFSDEARQSQEDALIRQEVALRRMFDSERQSWEDEKGQLLRLIASLQREIAERSEARAQAETMARKMLQVVSTLEKRLLQVEQGAQDEIRKLRAALMMGETGNVEITSSASGAGRKSISQGSMRSLGAELASGVRKLMRAHESNMRSLFAGREESAMRQTEGLRVHIESTVEQSEERINAIVENGVNGNVEYAEDSKRMEELDKKVSRLISMVSAFKNGFSSLSAAAPLSSSRKVEGSKFDSSDDNQTHTTSDSEDGSKAAPLTVETSGENHKSRSGSLADIEVPSRPRHARGENHKGEKSLSVENKGTEDKQIASESTQDTHGVEEDDSEKKASTGSDGNGDLVKGGSNYNNNRGTDSTGTGTGGSSSSSSSSNNNNNKNSSSSSSSASAMYIRVPNPDGGFFYFDVATQQLYEGDSEPLPEQILEEPRLDSPLRLPPRE